MRAQSVERLTGSKIGNVEVYDSKFSEIPATVTNTRTRSPPAILIDTHSDNDILVTMFICLFMNWNKRKPDYTHLFTSKTICSQYEHACVERRWMSPHSKTEQNFCRSVHEFVSEENGNKIVNSAVKRITLNSVLFRLFVLSSVARSRRSLEPFTALVDTTFDASTRWRALGSYTLTANANALSPLIYDMRDKILFWLESKAALPCLETFDLESELEDWGCFV